MKEFGKLLTFDWIIAKSFCGFFVNYGVVYQLCLMCFEDLEDDPYDSSEADPVKCQAIESSLWELKVIFA